jgi:sensor histidine kinase YesM
MELEDNGVGMPSPEAMERQAADAARSDGRIRIGMHNVAERLQVLYGEQAKMQVSSGEQGSGTLIRIVLPTMRASGNLKDTAAAMLYEIRSATRP